MSEASGFHVYALDHPVQVRTLRHKLMAIRSQRAELLTTGVAQDWADYRSRVGFLQGIDEALRVCDEIEQAERA